MQACLGNAGIDPAAQELEPGAEEILRDRAWRQFCELATTDAKYLKNLEGLESAGLELRQLRSTFDLFVEHADVERWPAEKVDPPNPSELKELIEDSCQEIEEWFFGSWKPWDERGGDEMMGHLDKVLRRYRNRRDTSVSELMAVAEEFEGN